MSAETKKHADNAKENLKAAEPYLKNAEEHARQSGDKDLHQKITKRDGLIDT